MKTGKLTKQRPLQEQKPPGSQGKMRPYPEVEKALLGKQLQGKVALITGGDSGIGQAVAALYAKEGADLMIVYLKEHKDAKETQRLVEKEGKRCQLNT